MDHTARVANLPYMVCRLVTLCSIRDRANLKTDWPNLLRKLTLKGTLASRLSQLMTGPPNDKDTGSPTLYESEGLAAQNTDSNPETLTEKNLPVTTNHASSKPIQKNWLLIRCCHAVLAGQVCPIEPSIAALARPQSSARNSSTSPCQLALILDHILVNFLAQTFGISYFEEFSSGEHPGQ